jgi:hypothetical protein
MNASYTGGFSVGTGVPRVKIIAVRKQLINGISHISNYECRVTSRNAYGFRYGEIITCEDYYLYDKHHIIAGPKVVSIGKEWRKEWIKE